MRNLPNLSGLTAFEATARRGSVTEAASELNLTQSAISRQIQTLEAYLGVALFVRRKKRLILTEMGVAYLDEVRPALEAIESATSVTTDAKHSVLNIATLPTFGAKWLVPRLGSFREANPKITVNLVTRSVPFDFALDHQLDGAIHFGTADWPGAVTRFLLKEETVAVATPDLARALKSAEDVARSPLLQIASRPFAWREWFESAGLHSQTYRPAMQVETFSMAIEAVTAGLCVGLLPVFFISEQLKAGKLEAILQIRIESSAAYYFVVPEGKQRRRTVKRFSEWLSAELEVR